MTGKEMKSERVKRGLTQVQLAEILGVNPVTVLRRERGQSKIRPESAVMILALPVPRKIPANRLPEPGERKRGPKKKV